MNRFAAAGIAAASITVVGAGALLWMDDPAPEERILEIIFQTAKAAEAKNLGDIMEAVSETFVGPSGMDKNETRRYVFAQLHRGAWRKVFVVSTRVELKDETHAHVVLGAVLASGDDIKSIDDLKKGTRADSFQFELDFAVEDDDWRVIRATYHRATLGEVTGAAAP